MQQVFDRTPGTDRDLIIWLEGQLKIVKAERDDSHLWTLIWFGATCLLIAVIVFAYIGGMR